MPVVRAQRVAFAHTDAVPLFEDASFHLNPGWTGLVGANGAGKTTLLRLLAGELLPARGTLVVEPDRALVHLCPQSVDALTAEVQALASAFDGGSRRLLGQLGLDPFALDRWDTLSPGERKRWQIGAALALRPDVLLLDEPTNHLDGGGRRWLENALCRHKGVGVLVSHDAALLESVTTATLRLHEGRLRLWPGTYPKARQAWEADLGARIDARRSAQAETRRLAGRLEETRREAQAAAKARHASRRTKDPKDRDARSMGARNLADWAAARHGRRVATSRRALERATGAVDEVTVEKAVGSAIFVDYVPCHQPILFSLDVPELSAGGAPLFGPLRLDVRRSARIHLEGDNGAGKTTLLSALLAGARIPRDGILHLPQDLDPDAVVGALESIRALPPKEKGRVLSLVAALGVPPERLLASGRPSPGEARKLLLARGLGAHAHALVLDEPTNHLDLPAIERLGEALEAYPGALLLVTHDAALAGRCTDTRWRVGDGRVEEASRGLNRPGEST